MIYSGDYQNGHIYGTQKNNKVVVTTEDDANFLSCTINVTMGDVSWTHNFEVPFFKNAAEFYFENYIHSIITQNFDLPTIEIDQLNVHSFDIADIDLSLKEMDQATVLDTLDLNFKMLLGDIEPLAITDVVDSNQKTKLDLPTPKLVTSNDVLSFSFISSKIPLRFVVNYGNTSTNIDFTPYTTDKLLHSFSLPVKLIESANSNSFSISIVFPEAPTFSLGTFEIIDRSIDSTLFGFQNNYGALSIIEFTGERREDVRMKTSVHEHVFQNKDYISTTNLDLSFPFTVNTGYMLEQEKYDLILLMIQSYNIYVKNETLTKLILSGSQRLMPYKSKYYQHNETIKFKQSENDSIHYRLF